MSSLTKTRHLAFYTCILGLLVAQHGGRAQAPTDALRFFNNFFVTGGYVVGGVGLWNSGSGSIAMDLPPDAEGAEALGAYLYYQIVTTDNPTLVNVNEGASFNEIPLNVPLGTQLLPTAAGLATSNATVACPLNGGTSQQVYTFRVDVLSRLDVDSNGRRVIEKGGGYSVSLPNTSTRRTLGASLVVIYRHPDPLHPLNAVVVYDGLFVKQQPVTLMQQVQGFYDPAPVAGQMTYIAGSAQSNLGEKLSGPFTQQDNVFDGAMGSAWDNVTVPTNPLAAGTMAFDTAIAPQSTGFFGFLVNDCVAMGAMIYQTQVKDGDFDGLLDIWETSTSLVDPNGAPLPNLKDMGANPGLKDIFIEVAAMKAVPGTTYGSVDAPLSSTIDSVTSSEGHLHMPTPETLRLLGQEFALKNIRVHFDVGNPADYKLLKSYPAQDYAESPYNSSVADAYIVGAGGTDLSGVSSGSNPALARGGEIIEETACTPGLLDHDGDPMTPPLEVDCQFPEYPGTVAWKRDVEIIKASVLDGNRKDSVRFALYAHAKASPKSLVACLGAEGAPAGIGANGDCLSGAPNPLAHVPGGVSGSGEYPGADFLITLGLWNNTNFVGEPLGVATTTMHELGHTLGLGHGGESMPNCKPNYLSVMNYMFQLGGLIDSLGVPHLGYSEQDLFDIVETSVTDGYSLPGPYRTSWYRPQPAGDSRTPVKRYCNGLKFPAGTPDTVRVNGDFSGTVDWNEDPGTPFSGPLDVNFDGEPDGGAPGGPTTTLTGFDDWSSLRLNQIGSRRNFGGLSIGPLGVKLLSDGSELLADGSVLLADGSVLLADGSVLLADGSVLLADGAELLADGSVLLADGIQLLADGVQLLSDGRRIMSDGSVLLADGSVLLADGVVLLADGARRLTDGSVLLADGSVLLADGVELLADGSVLLADGVELLADGSMLLADGSPLLADGNTVAWEFTEPSPLSAAESGTTPGPHSLTACVIGVGGCVDPDPPQNRLHRVSLDWEAPPLGSVDHYLLYRVLGNTVIPGSEGTPVEVSGSETSYVDTDELPKGVAGVEFTYFVEAVLDDGETVTPRSNYATITSANDAPVADNDDFSGTSPAQIAGDVFDGDTDLDGVFVGNDLSTDNWTAVLVAGVPAGQGVLALAGDGTFTYTPGSFVGQTSFTYKVNTGTWGTSGLSMSAESNTATVTITVLQPPLAFVPLRNLSPPAKPSNQGSSIPFEFKFTQGVGGPVVCDASPDPMVLITGPASAPVQYVFTPAVAPGGSWFKLPSAPGCTWQFNWKTLTPTGALLPKGDYKVEIKAQSTGQVFLGAAKITLK